MTLQQPTISAPAYVPAPGYAPASGNAAVPAAPAQFAAAMPQRVAPERYNVFSLVSLIGVFVVPIVGIVFGHLALRQISRTREPGRGFAVAGLWIGYVTIALTVLFVFVYVMIVFSMMLSLGSYYASLPADYYA